MKKVNIVIGFIVLSIPLFGQRTDFRAVLNGGLFSFGGTGANKGTNAITKQVTKEAFISIPFGAEKALSYGLSGDIRHVSKHNILSGVDLGVEVLTSKTPIIHISEITSSGGLGDYDATGASYLTHTFVTLNPYMGYRFNAAKAHIDVTLGIDAAYHINEKATEKGTATIVGGASYSSNSQIKTIQLDVRPKGQISISMNRIGIFGGYSYGISNYQPNDSWKGTFFSRLIRFGLTYQLNNKSL